MAFWCLRLLSKKTRTLGALATLVLRLRLRGSGAREEVAGESRFVPAASCAAASCSFAALLGSDRAEEAVNRGLEYESCEDEGDCSDDGSEAGFAASQRFAGIDGGF